MNTAADMFAQSLVDMTRSIRDHQESEVHLRERMQVVEQWRSRVKELEGEIAANLAEKYALRQQLARYCPDHPLLKNKLLVEKIQELGLRALTMNGTYDDARRIGETYFPAGTPPIK